MNYKVIASPETAWDSVSNTSNPTDPPSIEVQALNTSAAGIKFAGDSITKLYAGIREFSIKPSALMIMPPLAPRGTRQTFEERQLELSSYKNSLQSFKYRINCEKELLATVKTRIEKDKESLKKQKCALLREVIKLNTWAAKFNLSTSRYNEGQLSPTETSNMFLEQNIIATKKTQLILQKTALDKEAESLTDQEKIHAKSLEDLTKKQKLLLKFEIEWKQRYDNLK